MSATTTPWSIIESRLVDAGRMIAGNTRTARARTCSSCGAKVITGLDADICALPAVVDPTPLSIIGELLATIEGRRTYALAGEGGRLVLNYRDNYRISGAPAGTGWADVLPEHRCGATELPGVPSRLHRFAPIDLEAPCPF